ncbi:hypothetical protein FRX31_014323 [Thalictrum thalictroides]|uniref:Reverse transcriptase zinc-binding domain-containing protein n=1 Tax=Thalictrum thalictroides TaxID=46969 RepID=A0A7J6WF53_THATH|nr:hypothetical protein FRX31_014323 [Thalictrum thalictroides]
MNTPQIGTRNIRGMNNKAKEVVELIRIQNLRLMSMVETKIMGGNPNFILNRLDNTWTCCHNSNGQNGARIMVFWDTSVLNVQVLLINKQAIHLAIQDRTLNASYFLSCVYGSNARRERKDMWDLIYSFSTSIKLPWALFGDFNACKDLSEKEGGTPLSPSDIKDFNNCLIDANLTFLIPKATIKNINQLCMRFLWGGADLKKKRSKVAWKDPVPQNDLQVMELWSAVQNTSIYEEEEKDQIVWSPHPKGIFSISTAYAALRRRNTKVDWTRVVWHKTSIPRQSFTTWLAVMGKLDTQDRLLSWGVLKVSVCVLCSNKDLREKLSTTGTCQGTTAGRIAPYRNNKWPFICSKEHYKSKANTVITLPHSSQSGHMETHWHLFFDCKFSNQVWQNVLEWCGIRRKPYSAANEWKWVFKHLKGGGLWDAICRTALCATVSELWRERNARIFTGKYRSRNQVLWTIINEVQIRFMDLQISAHDNQRNR